MKKTYLLAASVLILLMPVYFLCCRERNNKNEYLRKVLNNLDQIKSATYFSTMTGNPPGDTITINTYKHFKKEFVNPADTFIGSAYVWFNADDTSRIYLYYDGNASVYVNHDTKSISIDSFKTSSLPFRPLGEPFFKQASSLIKYALETHDSIKTDLKDFGDSIRLRVFIPDKIITFHGKPYTSDSPYLSDEEKYSRYEIWINKSNDLPYKYMLKLSYATSTETCKNVEVNKIKLTDFRPAKYFPPDYVIMERGKNKAIIKDLTGKKAPDWILTDSENKTVALKDLKSKVLMIEFTGIGCAPCHSALPFLKQLITEYSNNDFELVSIETWGQNIDALKMFKNNNMLNYRFLASTDEVKRNYNAEAVPAFFILDRYRVIRKIIRGYSKGTTDGEIRDAINELN